MFNVSMEIIWNYSSGRWKIIRRSPRSSVSVGHLSGPSVRPCLSVCLLLLHAAVGNPHDGVNVAQQCEPLKI